MFPLSIPANRHRRLMAKSCFIAFAFFSVVAFAASVPPIDARGAPGYSCVIAPDGTAEHYFTVDLPSFSPPAKKGAVAIPDKEVRRITSRDGGRTWGLPESVVALPRGMKWYEMSPHALYDQSGQLHLFALNVGTPAQESWHAAKPAGQSEWTQWKFLSVCGPQNNPIQLKTGRIVVPVGYNLRRAKSTEAPAGAMAVGSELVNKEGKSVEAASAIPWDAARGGWENTTVYSDDGGSTWLRSPARLTVPVPADYPGVHPGGYEPVIVELNDGRVWMLLRTQTGYLYESFSTDGVEWSEPQPTLFRSSDAPASLTRLPNGDLVVVWNNTVLTRPRDGAFLYTGRDALHAAVSSDDGKTWKGFREIYRDPKQTDSALGVGDRGTAYPAAVATPDGNVLLVSGQGKDRRRIIVIDPAWLRERRHEDDFSAGIAQWSTFKSFGPPKMWGSERSAGAVCIPHPTRAGAQVMRVARPDGNAGDGAVWNFPAGQIGKVSLRVMLREGFQGGLITLTDRFYYPDIVDANAAGFELPISAEGRLGEGVVLEKNRWHDITLSWQVEQRPPRDRWPGVCTVSIDGIDRLSLPQLNRVPAGVSYLRLNSTAAQTDPAGFIVERVAAEVRLK
ncbi:sialidase family protein [Oleiharenicola lentus]|uniref:sialidase family protein n=1 Tax=Oleiharenicola lentus TaxID=2508720 RepID=UPI003F678F2D